jgi:hypothetical protein
MHGTMMAIVYSFFYSLIETDPKGINFFRVWRKRLPEMADDLDALEKIINPMHEGLRLFRNRFGFHGSTSRSHEASAFNVLKQFDGRKIYQAIIDTRNMSTILIQKHMKKEVS